MLRASVQIGGIVSVFGAALQQYYQHLVTRLLDQFCRNASQFNSLKSQHIIWLIHLLYSGTGMNCLASGPASVYHWCQGELSHFGYIAIQ